MLVHANQKTEEGRMMQDISISFIFLANHSNCGRVRGQETGPAAEVGKEA